MLVVDECADALYAAVRITPAHLSTLLLESAQATELQHKIYTQLCLESAHSTEIQHDIYTQLSPFSATLLSASTPCPSSSAYRPLILPRTMHHACSTQLGYTLVHKS